MSEQNESTTVARTSNGNGAIEQIRQRGMQAAAESKATREMFKVIEGAEWGSGNSMVRGSGFSPAARFALAKLCVVTRANPQLHIEILGGKFYHNAQYFRDKVSGDAHFIDDEQINISVSMSEQLREQATAAIEEARKLGLPEPTTEVQEMLAKAREIDRRRAEYSVPEWATVAIETVIRRYQEGSPLEAIRAGEIDGTEFIRVVRECNWAGNRPKARGRNGEYDADPVGNAEPAKTARTRSFRRCARNAFSIWFEQFDDEITAQQEIVEAEFEIVQEDRAAVSRQLPSGTDDQVLRTGGGEAQGVSGREVGQEQESESQSQSQQEEFDKPKAQRALFATLRDAGITDANRKQWAKDNDLPESTQLWEREHFDRAMEILIEPTRTKLEQGCKLLGVTVDELSLEVFGHRATMLKELQQLVSECNQRLDAVAAQDL